MRTKSVKFPVRCRNQMWVGWWGGRGEADMLGRSKSGFEPEKERIFDGKLEALARQEDYVIVREHM